MELNHIKFELVPAIQDDWGNFSIPSKENFFSRWMPTDPLGFNEKLTRVNVYNNSKIVFVIALMLRTTEIEVISILAQTLFASTLIPAYLRLEVLHFKNKVIFDSLHDIFLLHNQGTNDDNERLSAKLLDCFVKYESAKAYSGVKQDSKIFHKINPQVTQEWEEIKRNLNIGTME